MPFDRRQDSTWFAHTRINLIVFFAGLYYYVMMCGFFAKMELMKRFFDAGGSRCIMFYYQNIVKDDLRNPAGKTYHIVIFIAEFDATHC